MFVIALKISLRGLKFTNINEIYPPIFKNNCVFIYIANEFMEICVSDCWVFRDPVIKKGISYPYFFNKRCYFCKLVS